MKTSLRIRLTIETETRDGRQDNLAKVEDEMKIKKRVFSKQHAMCIHLNLVSIVGMVWYGFQLAGSFVKQE